LDLRQFLILLGRPAGEIGRHHFNLSEIDLAAGRASDGVTRVRASPDRQSVAP
jgi:hypothetical protein